MGRIRDLIKTFIEPQQVQDLPELAVEAGIGKNDIELLKRTRGGISWADFSGENKEPKERTENIANGRKSRQKAQTQVKDSQQETNRNSGEQR